MLNDQDASNNGLRKATPGQSPSELTRTLPDADAGAAAAARGNYQTRASIVNGGRMRERSTNRHSAPATKRRDKNTASKALSTLSAPTMEQRDRETEKRRNGGAETQSFGRYGVPHETHDADELPPSGARVDTLQQAAQMALADKSNGDPVFKFARAVKAFELSTDKRLPMDELPAAFNIWWNQAKTKLPPGTDREECSFLFMDAYDKAKTPLGANVIQNALTRVALSPPPPEADRYESPKLKTLVHLCYELQKLAGGSPFFLSVRDAARAVSLSEKSLNAATAFMRGLQRDGIIEIVEPGKPGGRRATRYRYVTNNQK
jgi:hypothetical protein